MGLQVLSPFTYLFIHMYKHTCMLHAQPPTHLPIYGTHVYITHHYLSISTHPPMCVHMYAYTLHIYIYPYIHVCMHMYTSHTHPPISPYICTCVHIAHIVYLPLVHACVHMYIHVTHMYAPVCPPTSTPPISLPFACPSQAALSPLCRPRCWARGWETNQELKGWKSKQRFGMTQPALPVGGTEEARGCAETRAPGPEWQI